jgi:hypothetical protein
VIAVLSHIFKIKIRIIRVLFCDVEKTRGGAIKHEQPARSVLCEAAPTPRDRIKSESNRQ